MMLFTVFVCVYVLALAGIFYFCVLADPDESRVALFLQETLPQRAWQLAERVLPKKSLLILQFFVDRALLIVYCAVVLGSWSVIFAYVYPWLDRQSYVSSYHKYIGYAVFAACITSWRYASTTSPGIITKNTLHRYDHFPFDGLLFVHGQTCKTTGLPRVARSKFDRIKYHANVPRYDHFCGWVYNTIGEENYRFFLAFLVVHVSMCAYGTTILGLLFYGEVLERKLFEISFFDRVTGEYVGTSKWIVLNFLFSRYLAESAVLMLMAVMFVALGLFLSSHVYLTCRNMTTNESYKWDQVKKWYKRELHRYDDAVKAGKIDPNRAKRDRSQPAISDQDITCTPTPGISAPGKPDAPGLVEYDDEEIEHPGPKPEYIYDRGLVENWKEVIFPISLRKIRTIPQGLERSTKPKIT